MSRQSNGSGASCLNRVALAVLRHLVLDSRRKALDECTQDKENHRHSGNDRAEHEEMGNGHGLDINLGDALDDQRTAKIQSQNRRNERPAKRMSHHRSHQVRTHPV